MNNSDKNKIVVADICNTLYDSNTTFDFVKYCNQKNKLDFGSSIIYRLTISKWSPFFWGIVLLQKLLRKDFQKLIVVSFFKNKEIAEVRSWASSFYNDVLVGKKIGMTNAILDQYLADTIVLASSTLYPVAEAIANIHGLVFVASPLEISGSSYTGKLVQELSGKKWQALQQMFGEDIELKLAMSDNLTDYELLSKAKRKIAVCYNESQEEKWRKLPEIEILKMKYGK